MSTIGKRERTTQARLVRLFADELGYEYLGEKPVQCLDYLIVHELIHIVERRHTDRFRSLLDRYLPRWRSYRRLLSEAPLGHADWNY